MNEAMQKLSILRERVSTQNGVPCTADGKIDFEKVYMSSHRFYYFSSFLLSEKGIPILCLCYVMFKFFHEIIFYFMYKFFYGITQFYNLLLEHKLILPLLSHPWSNRYLVFPLMIHSFMKPE